MSESKESKAIPNFQNRLQDRQISGGFSHGHKNRRKFNLLTYSSVKEYSLGTNL